MDAVPSGPIAEPSAAPAPVMSSQSKLRYPLRSAKIKREPATANKSAASATRRTQHVSTVSNSVSAFDLSGKEKCSKPPRRLSVPTKSPDSRLPATSSGSITPITENRMKHSKIQRKNETQVSNASNMNGRRKFGVLSSVSYWLTQIKLSETAAKHTISLGFFKLALEAGCEPLQLIREQLKLYALRHNLVAKLGQPATELLRSYDILADLERLRASEPRATEAEDGIQFVKVDKASSPSTTRVGSLKPRSLNSETHKMLGANKKENAPNVLSTGKTRALHNKTRANVDATNDVNGNRKKLNKANKMESNKGVGRVTRPAKQSTVEKENTKSSVEVPSSVADEIPEENKENLDNQPAEEVGLVEEIPSS